MWVRLLPLILHNLERSFKSNGIAFDYFDPQELDSTLTHGENIRIVLEQRGLRTREEWRTEFHRYREMRKAQGISSPGAYRE